MWRGITPWRWKRWAFWFIKSFFKDFIILWLNIMDFVYWGRQDSLHLLHMDTRCTLIWDLSMLEGLPALPATFYCTEVGLPTFGVVDGLGVCVFWGRLWSVVIWFTSFWGLAAFDLGSFSTIFTFFPYCVVSCEAWTFEIEWLRNLQFNESCPSLLQCVQ